MSGWGGGGGGSPGVPPTWRQPAHYSLWHRGLLELGNFFLLQFVHIGRFGYQLQVNKVLRLYSLVFEHTRKGLCQWTRCTISYKRSIKPRGRVVKHKQKKSCVYGSWCKLTMQISYIYQAAHVLSFSSLVSAVRECPPNPSKLKECHNASKLVH